MGNEPDIEKLLDSVSLIESSHFFRKWAKKRPEIQAPFGMNLLKIIPQ
jgi:hypothetical protein